MRITIVGSPALHPTLLASGPRLSTEEMGSRSANVSRLNLNSTPALSGAPSPIRTPAVATPEAGYEEDQPRYAVQPIARVVSRAGADDVIVCAIDVSDPNTSSGQVTVVPKTSAGRQLHASDDHEPNSAADVGIQASSPAGSIVTDKNRDLLMTPAPPVVTVYQNDPQPSYQDLQPGH